MKKREAIILALFLEELMNRFGTDGCNDMSIEDNYSNRCLMKAVVKGKDFAEEFAYKGRLYTNNIDVLEYLKNKFMEENEITKKDLVDTTQAL